MSQWISVKDRLPDIRRYFILAYFPHRVCKIDVTYWDKYESMTGYIITHETEDDILNQESEFTHWMPLPEPPDE